MKFLQGLFQTKDTKVEIETSSKTRALALLPGEKVCIVSGEENTAQLYRLKCDKLTGSPMESNNDILAVAASRDGRRVVTGTINGFTIWSSAEEVPFQVVRHAIGGVRTVDISSDSKWVATGSDARTTDLWDASTGERRPGLGQIKHEYNVVALKFCPCGERIVIATLFGSIRIFSTSTGEKLLTIPASVRFTLDVPTVTLAWFADRPQIFALSQSRVKCLSADDGTMVYQWFIRDIKHPSSIALSPNNKLIAYSVNNSVILRDTDGGTQINHTLEHEDIISCLTFSSGNDFLVIGADTKFVIWNLRKLVDNTGFFNITIEHAESCKRHKEDTTQKKPSSTFSLPLMSVTNGAVKAWLHGFLDHAEEVLSAEIENSAPVSDYNIFANRALVRGRMGNWSGALEDANQSLRIQRSSIGYIAKIIAFIRQGNHNLAIQEIPEVLATCSLDKDKFFVKVVQGILSCLSGGYDNEILNIMRLDMDSKNQKLLLLVQANMHLFAKQFDHAMVSFRNAEMPIMFPHGETPEMWSISFIFGWKFSGLAIQVQQRKCEFLLEHGKPEAADCFYDLTNTYQREIMLHAYLSDWTSEFRRKCLKELEGLGDKALHCKDYGEAIRQYTAVESLVGDPDLKHALLLKRSEAHVNFGSTNWDQALNDANKAIELVPSSPWGYDRKHAVLYERREYSEAAEALDQVVIRFPISMDSKSTELRKQGVKPGEMRKAILVAVEENLSEARPHVLIDTTSGYLCNKEKQIEVFKAVPEYKNLILSPMSRINANTAWQEVIQQFFRYSTFSHTWENDGEPQYLDVEKRKSINKLEESVPNAKLKIFCEKSHEFGYRWAWSDTCCINKAQQEAWSTSLRSMYQWYSGSSLTIVHLKGVFLQLEIGVDALLEILDGLLKEFVECRWNKRAWTLQEYFASRVIHFYTEDWKPYLPIPSDGPCINHKIHRAIQRGMQLVTGLSPDRLIALKPGSNDVRQKLSLASAREATKKEDIAYSLLGIFKVTIETIYGDDEVPRALGRLLGALLTQSADVTILAWTGKPSDYNSCLPAQLTVYQESQSVYVPSPIEASAFVSEPSMLPILSSEDLDVAVKLHDRLFDCPLPELHHGRLKLPCIWFPLPSVTPVTDPHLGASYIAPVRELGQVNIKTTEDLSSYRNMVLVHPWFRYLLDTGIPWSENARRESARRLLASLRQPFGALLLALDPSSRDYERIATDQCITVHIRDDVSPDRLLENVRLLYVR